MNQNEFLGVYIRTKISGRVINYDEKPISILRLAEREKCLHRLDDKTYYCGFKTRYPDKDKRECDAVIFVFSLELIGPSTGSSSSSEAVMKLVDFISKNLRKIDYQNYSKSSFMDKSRKSLAFLKIIKIIREDDIL